MSRIFISGVAGFIGSHCADLLSEEGHEVSGCDILIGQVHPSGEWPDYLTTENFTTHDVLSLTENIVGDADAILHLAARVGVKQSAEMPYPYVNENIGGTVAVMHAAQMAGIQRVVVASSMSVYGEGHMTKGMSEDMPTNPHSVYATTKLASEQIALQLGRVYGIDVLALRFFNTYGPRQTLSNPYTGLGAIFSQQIMNHEAPTVFEDGLQLRDFVHVSDVARACVMACEAPEKDTVINIGTGIPTSVLSFAQMLCDAHDAEVRPTITGHRREGDVRYVFADITRARELLGYEPRVMLEQGLKDLVEWARA